VLHHCNGRKILICADARTGFSYEISHRGVTEAAGFDLGAKTEDEVLASVIKRLNQITARPEKFIDRGGYNHHKDPPPVPDSEYDYPETLRR
jgi:hypothetical protein